MAEIIEFSETRRNLARLGEVSNLIADLDKNIADWRRQCVVWTMRRNELQQELDDLTERLSL